LSAVEEKNQSVKERPRLRRFCVLPFHISDIIMTFTVTCWCPRG
jgi:hypothetical protein